MRSASQVAMDSRNITVAHYPFGTGSITSEIEPVYYAYRAVAATGAKDSLDTIVIEQSLKQVSAMPVAPCKLVFSLEEPLGQKNLQAPRFEEADGRFHLRRRDMAGRRGEGYSVAVAKYHRMKHITHRQELQNNTMLNE